jgi:hypothetical protein
VAMREFRPKTNREKNFVICYWVSPKQWTKYAVASTVIKCIHNEQLTILFNFIKETLFSERRLLNLGKFFYSNSKGKIGRQKHGNNLEFLHAIKDDWLGNNLGHYRLRRILKKMFF